MSTPSRSLLRRIAAVVPAKGHSEHAPSPRPDFVPLALLGMPVLAIAGACLVAGAWWVLLIFGIGIALAVVLAVWSTGTSS